jgi:hypothetical protein
MDSPTSINRTEQTTNTKHEQYSAKKWNLNYSGNLLKRGGILRERERERERDAPCLIGIISIVECINRKLNLKQLLQDSVAATHNSSTTKP